jgi:hypothetical protein
MGIIRLYAGEGERSTAVLTVTRLKGGGMQKTQEGRVDSRYEQGFDSHVFRVIVDWTVTYLEFIHFVYTPTLTIVLFLCSAARCSPLPWWRSLSMLDRSQSGIPLAEIVRLPCSLVLSRMGAMAFDSTRRDFYYFECARSHLDVRPEPIWRPIPDLGDLMENER